MLKHNKNNKSLSQTLRRNMTREERTLWYRFLRYLPVRFRRQTMIGNYIVDFYCDKYKLVIELDGSQHYEEEAVQKDIERDAYLTSNGMTVLRYSDHDIHVQFRTVCEDILAHIPE